mgnify:FL=1|jgi:fatty acid desaturase|tara:strand:+ start:15290 stop:16315 length:1026 start_codon:yes stop_codon:yes gene_type:complete
MNSTSQELKEKVSTQSSFKNWLWPRFLVFPFLAIAAYPLFILEVGGDHWAVQSAWVIFLSYCWFCVSGSLHEAVHHTLFDSESANVWFGRILGLMIGIPYTVYKESHRRHHAYLNTSADYELWPYSDPGTSLAFRRVFVWVDLFFGVFTAPYIYGRIYYLKDPRLSSQVRRTIFWEYLAQVPYWMTFLGMVYFLCRRPDGTFIPFNPIWVLPLIISPMINTTRKFVEHIGLQSTDPILGTRTILPGNAISKLLCYFNFDIAVHGPHHRFPKAQHFELPARLKEYQTSHPELKVPIYSSYTSALISLLPLLWSFPATGNPEDISRQSNDKGDQIPWERTPHS